MKEISPHSIADRSYVFLPIAFVSYMADFPIRLDTPGRAGATSNLLVGLMEREITKLRIFLYLKCINEMSMDFSKLPKVSQWMKLRKHLDLFQILCI